MERIKKISSFVDDNSKVIDIGCDHGYLGIELIKQNRNISVISSDISSKAISYAKKNINREGLNSNIDLRVGNGLDVVDKDEINTVVIAGLGAHTQIEILINGIEKLEYVDSIILSPNSSEFYIRFNLEKLGFYIYDEDIVLENGKFYPILKLKSGSKKYTYDELLLGPILINKNSKVICQYYRDILNKKLNIYNNLPTIYKDKRNKLLLDINILEKHL